jgi:hypothetical protein
MKLCPDPYKLILLPFKTGKLEVPCILVFMQPHQTFRYLDIYL